MGRCSRWRWGWALAWTVVFAANLPLPLSLASDVTQSSGRLGMAVGVALLWVMGVAACLGPGKLGPALTIGGVPVGLLQLAPFLHLFVGLVALDAWSALTGKPWMGAQPQPLSETGGFVVTVLTGGGLLVVAGLFGLGVLAMRESKPASNATSASGAEV